MKIKLGQPDGDALRLAAKAEQCMDIGRRAQRIECGLLYTEYVLSKERLGLVKGKLEMQDVSAGLKTAADEALALKTKLPEGAKREADRLEKDANLLNSDIRRRWIEPKGASAPTAADLDGLRKKTAAIRKRMESIWTTARYTCSIPRPLPPIAEAQPTPPLPPPAAPTPMPQPAVAGRFLRPRFSRPFGR